tara:strand:- start:3027 stop:4616 length:1590 start_codon:yes stop_codon:yes gene_type:complete
MTWTTIADLILEKAEKQPDFEVLRFEHEGSYASRTYESLFENARSLVRGLKARGITNGDRVGLLIQNHPEFVELLIAAGLLGMVIVPLDPRMRGSKLAYMLNDTSCRAVVCGTYSIDAVHELKANLPSLETVILVDGDAAAYSELSAVGIDEILSAGPGASIEMTPLEATAPMQIMYTSGTTGDPKGIVLPHQRFIAASGYGELMFGYRPTERPYTGLSLTHGNAQFVTLAPSLAMELPAVFSRKFTKSRLWDIIRETDSTTFSLLGGMVTAIYSEPPRPDDFDNPVEFVVSAGMPPNLWTEFSRRFGVEITEFYGAMEGGLLLNPRGTGPIGSCGKPPSTLKTRVVDENLEDVGENQPGELLFANVDGTPFKVEYRGKPEASAKKVQDGWLRTGDVVRKDGDGWFYYLHRSGGGIRRNGEFISPSLIEKTLAEHPDVSDVFVWGVESAAGAPGEKDIVASIVPVETSQLTPDELFRWARGELEANMVPSFLQFVDQIPKTASEKPQERFLIDAFRADKAAVYTAEKVS